MVQKLKKNIILVIILAVLFYSALFFYFDLKLLSQNLSNFVSPNMIFALISILLSFFMKFIRWQYYINRAKIKVKFLDSLLVFLSGLIMSITPGKLGELIKSNLLLQMYNLQKEVLDGIILNERILEFSSLIVIFIISSFFFAFNYVVLLFFVLILFFSWILMKNNNSRKFILKLINKIPLLRNHKNNLILVKVKTLELLSIRNFLIVLIVSTIAWIFEILGYYFIIDHFQESSQFLFAVSSYCFSIIAGAISMLPGGLIATETSLMLILKNHGILENDAIAITIIIRFFTLWISIIIGTVSYFLLTRVIKAKKEVVKN